MQYRPRPARYHGHRYHQEQAEVLASLGTSTAAERAIWNLADRLREIDEAERILARGYMSRTDHDRVSAALCGRSPDEARAAARDRFARDYPEAVSVERLAA